APPPDSPFSVVQNSLQIASSLLAPNANANANATIDGAFPTGAFWTNLVLDDGTAPVATFPYTVKVDAHALHVAYPFRVVMPHVVQNGFVSEMVMSMATPATQHHVTQFDALSVHVRFFGSEDAARGGEFTALLVRGAPYVTAQYTNAVPTVGPREGITISKFKREVNQVLLDGNDVDFAIYSVQLSNNKLWFVYVSDKDIELKLQDGQLVATTEFTGVLRVAHCPDGFAAPFLHDGAAIYPIGGDVKMEAVSEYKNKDTAVLEFHWKTRSLTATKVAGERLLMLALPHHADALRSSVRDDIIFTSIRGIMKGVYGCVWSMEEELHDVEWDYADDGLFAPNSDADPKRQTMRQRAVELIVNKVSEDTKLYPQLPPDSYNFGKLIGREARLLLTALRFGQNDTAAAVQTKMERELERWLAGSNPNALRFDERFGGVLTTDGFNNPQADFGNGRYNDHHFHYGYLIYALAVLRKTDPSFIDEHALAIALLIGDIATPFDPTSTVMSVPVAKFFPVARHKDWYVGHSYASGLFPMQFTRLLLATEIRATKMYWHIEPNSKIYEPFFAQNAMVGVVGELSVVYSTWFGDEPVYVHGINMIPFTPISSILLDEPYTVREFPLIEPDFAKLPATDIWKSVICLDHAILDAATAWNEFFDNVRALDTWNSASNSLHWIATRRSWFDQKDRKALTTVTTNDGDQCFGFPECSTAGPNGTALGCCDSLPGCCPSGLACCPPRNTSNIPPNACHSEPKCAALGLDCCGSFDGCCEPNSFTGGVMCCCKNQSATLAPRINRNPTGACHGQPQCAAAGLDCCKSRDGCCVPDPLTNVVLGCCTADIADSGSATAPSSATATATCQNQPRCAAAKLDCCATPQGCCQPDTSGAKLDCCNDVADAKSAPAAGSATATTTCQHQPRCAAANLDCCATPQGCCQPDATGAMLDCCDAPTASPSPTPLGDGTCHNEPQCLTAGENHTALLCCFTPQGCCPGLLCCQGSASTSPKHVQTQGSGDTVTTVGTGSVTNRAFAAILLTFLGAALIYCLATCYRRRHYSPIERDMRSWYCVGVMAVTVAFFIYLVMRSD
ncbi:TPA: hypothetical protein N0F65_012734, partial [Lagenidium giganteum]